MANGLRGPLRANGGDALGKAGALRSQDELESPRSGSPAEELFTDHDGSRAARFSTELVGNRFRELQAARPAQREAAIRAGLIHDEENPRAFDDPILLRGTCRDMCPEYEREEREFKKNVDRWELRDGPAGLQGRIDPARAVSAFSRPAAGKDTGDEQVLPSDMRDPETLSRTLDYLFRTILSRPPHDPSIPATPFNSLKATHPFIWDRTRQVRQEFSKQKHWGLEHAVSGHERIARYHILCLRELRKTGINLQQEAEQLRKTLVSLTHYYNDLRMDTGNDMPCANEAEFRAYLLILDMFDPETARATSVLPHAVFSQPILKLAFDLHALVQRNFDSQKAASRGNIQVAQNFASRFFKMVRSQRVPFVMACLLESRFADVRRAGLRALHQSYPKSDDPSKRMSISALLRMFGCVNEDEVVEMVEAVEMEVVYEDEGPAGVLINRSAPYNDNRDPPAAEPWPSITAKQGHASYSDIIDGSAGVQAGSEPSRKPSIAAPTAFTLSKSATTGSAFAGFGARPTLDSFSAFSSTPPQPLQPSNRQSTVTKPVHQAPQPSPASTAPPSFSFAKPSPPSVAQVTQPTIPMPAPSVPQVAAPSPSRPTPPPAVETHYEDAVAAVADQLITETVQQVTKEIATAVLRDLQLEAERSLSVARSQARSDLLDQVAESLYSSMLHIPLRGTAIEAVMREAQHRNLTRTVGRYWREWARVQREDREERQRRRMAFSKRMEDMRLSRKLVSHVDVEKASDDVDDASAEQSYEIRSDLKRAEELRKAQAERALFWEPGTYLEAIANHVNFLFPRLRRRDSSESDSPVLQRPAWKVMVAATTQDTGNWLRRKLAVGKPPIHCDRVTVHSISAPDRKRASRKGYASVGLVIFEVSRAAYTSDEATKARYLDDKERYNQLQEVLGSTNVYKPAILLVTWDDEPLSALCQRLGVSMEGPQAFIQIGHMSLGRECADVAPLKAALPETLKRIIRKPRFDLPLLPLVQAVYPLWTELLLLANSVLERPDQDWLDYSVVLQIMIDSVNDLRRVILTTVASEYTGRSLGIVKLPTFDGAEKINGPGHATSILLKYLQQPAFAGMDDVSLLVPDVRARLLGSTPPPTKLVLENLAYAVSSRLANCSLPLDSYDDMHDQQVRVRQLCDGARNGYSSLVVSKAAVIKRLLKSAPCAPADNDVFTMSSDETMLDEPIRALPDLSNFAAIHPQESTPRKRRIEATISTDSTPSSGRESKMLRLRKLMSQVSQDLAVSSSSVST